MKKMTKKLGAIVLALAMCFSLCCTALVTAAEAGTYTITVSNTTQGYTYAAYKIFDATVGENGNVAYYITEANPWFDIITEGYTADASGVYTTECFVLTPTNTDAGYTVQMRSDVEDSDIIAYFNSKIKMEEIIDETTGEGTGVYKLVSPEGVEPVTSATGNGSDLTLDVSDAGAGYYFVTSTLGATVTITTTDPQADVIDKNTPPGDLKKIVNDGLDEDDSSHEDAEAMGDYVEFTVTANVPLYAPGDDEQPEGYLVTDYEFIDHMSAGLEITDLETIENATAESDCDYYTKEVLNTETGEYETHYYATNKLINQWVQLTQGDTTYYLVGGWDSDGNADATIKGVAHEVYLELTDPTEDANGNIQFDGFTLTYDTIDMNVYNEVVPKDDEGIATGFDNAEELVQAMLAADPYSANYPVNATITIDYTAHVTDEAVYDNTNEINMDWHMTPYKNPKPEEPEYTGSDEDEDNVYVLTLDILKVDGSDGTSPLEGAQFQLSGENLNQVVTSTDYRYTALESLSEYETEKAAGTELWFKLDDGSYTDVDPYVLLENDPNADVSHYVKNPYAEEPDKYPDAEGYTYVAYTRSVTHSGGLQSAENSTVTGWTDENGQLTFTGLTVGEWTLTEITAPDGYNLLPEDFKMTISVSWGTNAAGEIVPTFTMSADSNDSYNLDPATGVISITVENNQGTELPGTGGIGTTIFYIIGGVLVVGAVVVLVTRRRVNREA